jgi:hypothetical protein
VNEVADQVAASDQSEAVDHRATTCRTGCRLAIPGTADHVRHFSMRMETES